MNVLAHVRSWTLQLATALLLGLALSILFPSLSKAGSIDAVSGASLSVTGGTTTATSATFTWKEKYSNGELRLFWDSVNTSRSKMRDTVVQTGTGRPTTLTIPDRGRSLKPGTRYNYILQGYYQGSLDASYVVKGTFTTDALPDGGTSGIAATGHAAGIGYRLVGGSVQLLSPKAGSLARWRALDGRLLLSQQVPESGLLATPKAAGLLLLEVSEGRKLLGRSRVALTGH